MINKVIIVLLLNISCNTAGPGMPNMHYIIGSKKKAMAPLKFKALHIT